MTVGKLSELDTFKRGGFTPQYPANMRSFYSPVDDVPGALRAMFSSARISLVLAMYGFDDQVLADIIKAKLASPDIFVQLTLDASQAAGVHEKAILAEENYPASSIAIGSSEGHAIMHLKLAVIDGLYRVSGSTNWSLGGETKQSNELTIIQDPYVCAEARARIDATHASILSRKKP
jgi:phosphatidylserine/phosphatidylglycerophosphate/cardiolipin synthase-like enzyme